jgi:hypothetical protein
LTVLQRYEKKYQRYKEAAIGVNAAITQSTQHYNGENLNGKSYREAVSLCDIELRTKIEKAEQTQAQKQQQLHQARLQQLQTEAQQQQFALAEALKGIRNYCFAYLTAPTLAHLSPNAEGKLSLDRATYSMLRDKATEIWPDSLKSRHELSFTDAQDVAQTQEYSLSEWYHYCDKVFADYAVSLSAMRIKQKEQEDAILPDDDSALDEEPLDDAELEDEGDFSEEDITEDDTALSDTEEDLTEDDAVLSDDDSGLDTIPVDDSGDAHIDTVAQDDDATTEASETEVLEEDATVSETEVLEGEEMPLEGDTDAETNTDADADNNTDADTDADSAAQWQALRAQVKGDRLKTLENMGRMPDYSDNDDAIEKAKVWMFENAETGRCEIYTFTTGDKLRSKRFRDECPL